MKKSLIALAALAAFGTASAQSTVTIGGTYNFGFQKTDSGATKADFFDSKINFSGTEDLGGGLKASFNVEFQMGGRQDLTTKPAVTATSTSTVNEDSTVTTATTGTVPNQAKATGVWGRNATVSLAGGFGTVTGGRVEGTNTIESAIVSGQSLDKGFDQAALTGAKSNFNTIGYTTPDVSGFKVSVTQLKALDSAFAPATGTANTETTINVLGASYANGPLVAGFAYKMVDAANAVKGKKTEMFGTYDLGVAKLGLGYAKNSGDAYVGEKAGLLLSGAIPLGALTLGADYYTRGAGGTSAAKDSKATALVANYALSKRTNLRATIGKLTGTSLVSEQQYRVGMYHTF